MKLIAECDHCMDQVEVRQFDADAFETGMCIECGMGMCRACQEPLRDLHKDCLIEYEDGTSDE